MSASEQLAFCEWRRMVKDAYDAAGSKYVGSIDVRWRQSFDNFRVDMGQPRAGQKLQRLDVSQPFSKQNCTWG